MTYSGRESLDPAEQDLAAAELHRPFPEPALALPRPPRGRGLRPTRDVVMDVRDDQGGAFRFSTEDWPEQDRVEMLRDVIGRQVCRLDIEPLRDATFRVDCTAHALPGLHIISCETGGGVRVSRTPELMSDGRDDLVLAMNLSGRTIVSQRDQELVLNGHEATLVSTAEAGGIIRATAGLFQSLCIPRAAIAPLLGQADDALMRHIPRNAAALQLLTRYVGILQKNLALAPSELRPLIVNHVCDLVAASVGATRDAMEVARGRGMRAARLAAIRGDVLANLSQMRLSAKTVASRHGLTDRYVHLLFEETGQTFGQFVEEQRLKRAYTLLTDPTHVATRIGEIASHVGFGEPSSFNRAFRRRFGDTPGGVRRTRTRDSQD
jgi:AraC-like DNA-binding protein